MILRRLWFVLIVLSALLAPSAAQGQRLYAPNMIAVVQRVADLCPGLVLRDHEFTDAVATVLHNGATLAAYRDQPSLTLSPNRDWGRNGKRGNANDPSHDAIFYRTGASPFGGAVIDIIGSAGSPNAAPAWIDQTDPTIAAGTTGVFVQPSGRLPACLTGGGTVVIPPPVDPPPPTQDHSAQILAALARIQADVDELKNRPQPEPAPPDPRITAFIEAMVGAGPGDGVPNHITDIKERIDAFRAAVEAGFAWLRGRAVLRY